MHPTRLHTRVRPGLSINPRVPSNHVLRRLRLRVIGAALFLAVSPPWHPSPGAASSGTEGAAFLDIPVGAGPAALGSAYSALAADAYAPVWNAAGLGVLPDTQIAAQHLWYLESIHYEFLSFAHPISPRKGFGGAAQFLGTGDIAGTDPSGNSLGDYSSHYGAYSLAYGQKVTDELSLGITGKWIHAQLADVTANAYAVDFGSLYQLQRLKLAFTLTNLGTRLKFTDQADSLPLSAHLAGAYEPAKHWKLMGEGVYAQTGLASGRVGMEWNPLAMVALRAGYRTDTLKGLSALAGLTLGVGVRAWEQELAYAWLPYGDLGDTQYFSLLLRFGEVPNAKRNLIKYNSIKKHRSAQGDKQDPEYLQLLELLDKNRDPTVQAPKEDNR